MKKLLLFLFMFTVTAQAQWMGNYGTADTVPLFWTNVDSTISLLPIAADSACVWRFRQPSGATSPVLVESTFYSSSSTPTLASLMRGTGHYVFRAKASDGSNTEGIYFVDIKGWDYINSKRIYGLFKTYSWSCGGNYNEVRIASTETTTTLLGNVNGNVTGSVGNLLAVASGAIEDVDVADNVKVDINTWLAGVIPAPNVTGVPIVQTKYWGTAISALAEQTTGGYPKTDATLWATTAIPAPIVTGIPTVATKYWGTTTTALAEPTISTTAYPQIDMWALSTDATAANNAESFFDGTGYAGTNNVIPTVTSVTNSVTLADNSIKRATTDTSYIKEMKESIDDTLGLAHGTGAWGAAGGSNWTDAQRDSVLIWLGNWSPISQADSLIVDQSTLEDITVASVTGNVGAVATGGITSTSFADGAITIAKFPAYRNVLDSLILEVFIYRPPNMVANPDFEGQGTLTDAAPKNWIITAGDNYGTRANSFVGKYSMYLKASSDGDSAVVRMATTAGAASGFEVPPNHWIRWGVAFTNSNLGTGRAVIRLKSALGGQLDSIILNSPGGWDMLTKSYNAVATDGFWVEFFIKGIGVSSCSLFVDGVFAFLTPDTLNQPIALSDAANQALADTLARQDFALTWPNLIPNYSFELDGTLTNSIPIHWTAVAGDNFGTMPEPFTGRYAGYVQYNAIGDSAVIKSKSFYASDNIWINYGGQFKNTSVVNSIERFRLKNSVGTTVDSVIGFGSSSFSPRAKLFNVTSSDEYYLELFFKSDGVASNETLLFDNIYAMVMPDTLNQLATLAAGQFTKVNDSTWLRAFDTSPPAGSYADSAGGWGAIGGGGSADTLAIARQVWRFPDAITLADTIPKVYAVNAGASNPDTVAKYVWQYQGTVTLNDTIPKVFAVNAGAGISGAYKLTLLARDSTGTTNLPNVPIQLRKKGTGLYSNVLSTGDNATVQFDVSADTLEIFSWPIGYTHTSPSQIVMPTADLTDTVYYSKFSPSAPTMANGVVLTGYAFDFGWEYSSGQNAEVSLSSDFKKRKLYYRDAADTSKYYALNLDKTITDEIDQNGLFSFEVIRSSVLYYFDVSTQTYSIAGKDQNGDGIISIAERVTYSVKLPGVSGSIDIHALDQTSQTIKEGQ